MVVEVVGQIKTVSCEDLDRRTPVIRIWVGFDVARGGVVIPSPDFDGIVGPLHGDNLSTSGIEAIAVAGCVIILNDTSDRACTSSRIVVAIGVGDDSRTWLVAID